MKNINKVFETEKYRIYKVDDHYEGYFNTYIDDPDLMYDQELGLFVAMYEDLKTCIRSCEEFIIYMKRRAIFG